MATNNEPIQARKGKNKEKVKSVRVYSWHNEYKWFAFHLVRPSLDLFPQYTQLRTEQNWEHVEEKVLEKNPNELMENIERRSREGQENRWMDRQLKCIFYGNNRPSSTSPALWSTFYRPFLSPCTPPSWCRYNLHSSCQSLMWSLPKHRNEDNNIHRPPITPHGAFSVCTRSTYRLVHRTPPMGTSVLTRSCGRQRGHGQ